MVTLTPTIRLLEYAGRQYRAGERFEAPAKDAELMIAIGRARRVDMTPDTVAETARPRRYARRDMRAET